MLYQDTLPFPPPPFYPWPTCQCEKNPLASPVFLTQPSRVVQTPEGNNLYCMTLQLSSCPIGDSPCCTQDIYKVRCPECQFACRKCPPPQLI